MKRLLILSDLHVGRDCKEITGFNQARPDPEFDQAFVDLLDHYTRDREGQWKLVFAGDFIDFLEVVITTGASGAFGLRLTFDVTDEEREFGLGSEAERALVKLERSMTYHRSFFARLAKFVRAGGELAIVRGNHDVEFYWPKVQRALRHELANLAFKHDKLEVDEAIEQRNAFQQRIEFVPWFYYEERRIYLEHGHQYDPYCSFDHWLHPVSPENPSRIDTPISLFGMRYFVNLNSDFSTYHADIWGWRDYLDWLRAKGLGGSLYVAKMALGAGFRALEYGVTLSFGRVRQYNNEHLRKLRELAAHYGIRAGKLGAIDRLHHVPVNHNLPELMRLLFVDRVLLVLGGLLVAGLVLLVVDPAWLELLGVVLVGLLGYRINQLMQPRRYILPGPKQAASARRIAEMLDVPLVVMGHSHVKAVEDLGHGRRYINIGSWLPPFEGRGHVDPAEPCTCRLSHVVVEHDGTADLRVFCKATKTVRVSELGEAPRRGESAIRPAPAESTARTEAMGGGE